MLRTKNDKFNIELESDKGKEELLSYIKKKDIEFKEQDEERVLKRMRLLARELSFKDFTDLLENECPGSQMSIADCAPAAAVALLLGDCLTINN